MNWKTRMCSLAIVAVALAVQSALSAPLARAQGSKDVKLEVALGHPMMLAGEKGTNYLRVAMTGVKSDKPDKRPPVNVAIVLDKSGSMQGEKIAKAKEAAAMAISRLRPTDVVSVVTYDSTVSVLVPATRASDKEQIIDRIQWIQADGSTALFGGVSKGANEVRKFAALGYVNRIVLLSDGLANVGPSSPGDLAELGTSLVSEGISVTTIGLGLDYNEDLMTQLAQNSDGNHMFAENAVDLAKAFDQEFGDVLSVVARDVTVKVVCADGVRPVQALGREAEIVGQTVTTSLNQLYGDQTKYLLIEVETPRGTTAKELEVARVFVSYLGAVDIPKEAGRAVYTDLGANVALTFTDSPQLVEEAANKVVMASAVHQIGMERNRMALELRDQGRVDEAKKILLDNVDYLNLNGLMFDSQELREYSAVNNLAVQNMDNAADWQRQRKIMRKEQHDISQQQAN